MRLIGTGTNELLPDTNKAAVKHDDPKREKHRVLTVRYVRAIFNPRTASSDMTGRKKMTNL